jgi:hypothetical protein
MFAAAAPVIYPVQQVHPVVGLFLAKDVIEGVVLLQRHDSEHEWRN